MRTLITVIYLAFLQPAALLTWAGFIILFHIAFRLLGWRELTSVLSGTFPADVPPPVATSLASVYLISYFAAVLVAPILSLAAILNLLILKVGKRV